jgi:hypothetical protein
MCAKHAQEYDDGRKIYNVENLDQALLIGRDAAKQMHKQATTMAESTNTTTTTE